MSLTIQKPFLKFLTCLVLAGVTFAAFAGVALCSFIVLDDGGYVVDNPAVQHGLSWGAVKWAFSTFDCSNWHPITWLSHIVDFQFYGLDPVGHHLTNLAFHVANAVLLFLLFERMTARLWPSAFVALLFGIHPMHVESVAWVAELKDVLSAFFFLLTLLVYTRYVELASRANPKSATRNLRWAYYVLALVFFALGLMSKPMLVTVPFVLLLLDFWPLQRFFASGAATASPLQRLLVEKLPFCLLSAASCYVTFLAQSRSGAVRSVGEYSLLGRIEHIAVAYVWYVLKFLWPVHLSVYYISLAGDTVLKVVSSSLLLLVITAFAIRRAGKHPWFLFGWLWFLGMLVPVIGLVQVGGQAYADRYSYLPYIGLFIIIAWGIPDLVGTLRCGVTARKPGGTFEAGPSATLVAPLDTARAAVAAPLAKSSDPGTCILFVGAAAVAVACFVRTVQEVGYWKNSVTLFSRAVELDPKNEVAWALLGAEYFNLGNNGKAADCLNHSVALDPKYYLAWQYLGSLLNRKGDLAGAQNAWQTALRCSAPDEARINIYNRLGHLYMASGNFSNAISNYQNSLELSADQPQAQAELGQCLLQTKQPEAAAAAFQNSIDLQPENSEAQLGLGMLSAGNGTYSDALVHLRAAVKADTNSVMALGNLAWLLAAAPDPALRNGPEAVSLAEHACQLTRYQQAKFIGTLAAAYAEAGRFDDAIATAQKAHDIALTNRDSHVAARNAQLMELYKSHHAYHMEDDEFKAKN
ncbi:MAG TPA: tetratricopeptide repeat protein [Candidatus Acidoferrales bacterium]|jgi:tetratricopeptide (TPR) repeat protein|nr:tetratricopeptide repeat protein [Candidatus Acidoferrales bacterium]